MEALAKYGEQIIIRRIWTVEDFTAGDVARCTDCQAGVTQNEAQTLTVTASGGTFTLSFRAVVTANLAWNIDASTLQSTLRSLSTIGAGNVTVSGGPASTAPLTLTFISDLANTALPLVVGDGVLLTGITTQIKVEEVQVGSNQQARVSNVYKQTGDEFCVSCLGANYEGGYRPVIDIMYALITDDNRDVIRSKQGVFHENNPKAQFPWTPSLNEEDLLVRVQQWAPDGVTPLVLGDRYLLRDVTPVSLRTGTSPVLDTLVIGQTCEIQNVPPHHPVSQVPLIGEPITIIEANNSA